MVSHSPTQFGGHNYCGGCVHNISSLQFKRVSVLYLVAFYDEGGGLEVGKAVKQTVWAGAGSNVQETDFQEIAFGYFLVFFNKIKPTAPQATEKYYI